MAHNRTISPDLFPGAETIANHISPSISPGELDERPSRDTRHGNHRKPQQSSTRP
jgi:hypothetical protein